jgi:hypothetical protein
LLEAGQADEAEGFVDAFGHLDALDLAQRVGDVLEDGHVRPEGVVLEHHAQIPLVGLHELAVRYGYDDVSADGDAAFVRLLQPADHA